VIIQLSTAPAKYHRTILVKRRSRSSDESYIV